MTIRTVLAVAVAAGVTTFASLNPAAAEGADFFEKAAQAKKEAKVDTVETGSIGKEAQRPELVVARAKPAAHRPALTAIERSSEKKFTALPGVKPVKIEGASAPTKTAKVAGGAKYTTIVSRYAASYGVPVSLAHAVISVESNYRADARGSAGEIGLMQIKPATARMLGYTGSAKGLYDPDTNIKWGMKYLAKAHDLGGGSTCGTILKYNAGHGAKRMNPISAAYCAKVKRILSGA
ncbi:lytic transglycosylase domain-containing protein [Tianweitania sediminis]|uniref:Transglycosylase SLT domain-containing protein n=1 Tax=Tianweitania sediminis TaxID=1502156 RepID=A0A8J7R2T1_9HYPH|nr:transglycosylase SLT domain-containing protein [Tianweitania sediminis]MBP0439210.1 transglycosylase SLT domain-containing protein [Tianweitania sediminis]